MMLPEPTLNSYLMLGAVLVAIGATGVFVRRRLMMVGLTSQIMLAGVSLTFVAADRYRGAVAGQRFAVMTALVALCQVVVCLATARALKRDRRHRAATAASVEE